MLRNRRHKNDFRISMSWMCVKETLHSYRITEFNRFHWSQLPCTHLHTFPQNVEISARNCVTFSWSISILQLGSSRSNIKRLRVKKNQIYTYIYFFFILFAWITGFAASCDVNNSDIGYIDLNCKLIYFAKIDALPCEKNAFADDVSIQLLISNNR